MVGLAPFIVIGLCDEVTSIENQSWLSIYAYTFKIEGVIIQI
jgi:hypothetical protein